MNIGDQLDPRRHLRLDYARAGIDEVFVEQLLRDLAEIPDDPERLEHLETVVGEIDLPPEKSVARRGRVVMVIVVPAFAERDHREREAVAAVVAGLVAAPAEDVGERVDRERAVREHNRRDKESPDEHLRAGGVQTRSLALKQRAESEQREAEHGGHQDVESIEENQL